MLNTYMNSFLNNSISYLFINDDSIEKEYVLGLMNSRLADYILNLLTPSKNFQVGDISMGKEKCKNE